jgi:hypothetical protein
MWPRWFVFTSRPGKTALHELDRQAFAAFGTTGVDDGSPGAGFHSGTKPVSTCSANFGGLVSSFHGFCTAFTNRFKKILAIVPTRAKHARASVEVHSKARFGVPSEYRQAAITYLLQNSYDGVYKKRTIFYRCICLHFFKQVRFKVMCFR